MCVSCVGLFPAIPAWAKTKLIMMIVRFIQFRVWIDLSNVSWHFWYGWKSSRELSNSSINTFFFNWQVCECANSRKWIKQNRCFRIVSCEKSLRLPRREKVVILCVIHYILLVVICMIYYICFSARRQSLKYLLGTAFFFSNFRLFL